MEAVGGVHAATCARQHPHRHHTQHHQSTYSGGGAGTGLIHPPMYASPYPAQHDMVRSVVLYTLNLVIFLTSCGLRNHGSASDIIGCVRVLQLFAVPRWKRVCLVGEEVSL